MCCFWKFNLHKILISSNRYSWIIFIIIYYQNTHKRDKEILNPLPRVTRVSRSLHAKPSIKTIWVVRKWPVAIQNFYFNPVYPHFPVAVHNTPTWNLVINIIKNKPQTISRFLSFNLLCFFFFYINKTILKREPLTR